jgi:glycosyltransferase involved in cell wall biosynthesis
MNALFSVIIPTYKRNKFLEKTLESILFQKIKPLEVILVDDANDFKTKEILEKFKKKITEFDAIYISNTRHKGALISRNKAAKIAKGSYLAFLDDDDTWDESYLENAKNTITDYNYDLIISKIIEVRQNKIINEKVIPADFNIEDYLFKNPGMLCSNLIIKKTCFTNLEGYDDKIEGAADKDLFIRAVLKKYEYIILNNNRVLYKIHDDQWSKDYKKILSQKIFFFIKYFRFYMSIQKLYKMFKLIISYLYLIIKKNK